MDTKQITIELSADDVVIITEALYKQYEALGKQSERTGHYMFQHFLEHKMFRLSSFAEQISNLF